MVDYKRHRRAWLSSFCFWIFGFYANVLWL